MKRDQITQERLKELLVYNPETGIFTNRITRSHNAKKGDIAGYIDNSNGYEYICVDNVKYRSNRLAWLYIEGYFPENDVDHKNRIKTDNRWKNLRHLSRSCNSKNICASKRNKSGVVGVCWIKRIKSWQVQIAVDGKTTHFGYYKDFVKAVRTRYNLEIKYGYTSCNNESSAYNYLKINNLL